MNSLRIQVISNLSHRLTGLKFLSSSFLYNRLDIFIHKSKFTFFCLCRCTCFFINFHLLNRRNMSDNAQVRRHSFLIRIDLETIGHICRWSILQFITLTSKFIVFYEAKNLLTSTFSNLWTNKSFFSFERKMIAFFFPQKKRFNFFTKNEAFEISSARKSFNLMAKKRLNFSCRTKRLHFLLQKLT